jgi:HD-GYP domain-containing protein (c-di-GMP phosphodiesterase class II)
MTPTMIRDTAVDLLIGGEIAGIGAVWVPIHADGPRWPVVDDPIANWRQALVAGAAPIRTALQNRLGEVMSGPGAAVELLPGIAAIGSVLPDREQEPGGVAILPTAELVSEGSISMLCNTARLDETLVRSLAAEATLPPRAAVPALSVLVRRLHRAAVERMRDRASQQSVDRRLAESYEELHLLNSLIDGLVLGGDADDFLRTACAELAATAGYGWIAVLVDEPGGVVADELVLHGDGAPSRSRLRALADESAQAIATAIETADEGEIGVASIRGGGRTIGTLLAGGRGGDAMSSVELTLLASAAGHLGVFLRNAMLYADLDAMFLGTLQAMVAAIDAKDPYTRGHSQRVAELSRDLAAAIGLPDSFVRTAHLAGLVHDIGKIGVPEAVLRKAGRLTDDEFSLIRQHPQTGYRILKDIPQIRDLLPGVLCHHEAWDGSGYPAGLEAREIPLLARIVAICDSFDAMSSNRTYRNARPRDEVFAEIRRCAGVKYDPDIVPVFLGMNFAAYERLLERDARDLHDDDGGEA